MRHVIFTGGGTAGHLFPGLAVAGELVELAPGLRITFAGTGAAIERQSVEAAGFRYHALPCRPLPQSTWQALQFIGDNARGYWQAGRLLHHLRTSAVVGLGGFASVPLARAAIAADVPLVLLEQNAWPGRATRWLAPAASLICASFELPAEALRAACPVRVTGNPVRAGFVACSQMDDRSRRESVTLCQAEWNRPRLVVLGGSQGASSLNRYVPRALHKLRDLLQGWEIIHQCGQRDYQATRSLYARVQIDAQVLPFIGHLPEVVSCADLAISRAGGTTLAELAAAGVPALLAPYPHAADDHQRRNARVYVDAGGCLLVEQNDHDERFDKRLAATLGPLLANRQLRERMAAAMRLQARPDAAWRVATLIAEIAQPLRRAAAA
jgi:UDP-N-acetylglucosamine--N-acetylmuramyl-(pentapeptide) pyrophosphoryl-undecaprenol N-acetylglucosamine transferase